MLYEQDSDKTLDASLVALCGLEYHWTDSHISGYLACPSAQGTKDIGRDEPSVIVLSGVRIGNGAVIGAGSVVTHDIPDEAVAVGVPARVIKIREKDAKERKPDESFYTTR